MAIMMDRKKEKRLVFSMKRDCFGWKTIEKKLQTEIGVPKLKCTVLEELDGGETTVVRTYIGNKIELLMMIF